MVKLTGNEKAFLGGLLAFLSTNIVLLQQQNGGYSWHDFAWSVGAWVVVHLGVWLTTNSVSVDTPVVVPKTISVSAPVNKTTDTSAPTQPA